MIDNTARAEIPRDVRLVIAALGFGAIAFSVLATVIGLQVFDLTDSEQDLGFVGLAQFLPILLLSPYAGTLADRFDRRIVYACGLVAMALCSLGLLLYAGSNPTSVWPYFALLALNSAARAIGVPASRSLPIDLAPDDAVERIVAVRSLTFQIALIVGPLMGAFANRRSTVLPYVIIIVAQLLALAIMSQVARPSTEKLDSAPGAKQVIRDAIEGLRFIRRSQVVLGAISLDLFAVLFGGAVALLPAIVEKRLGMDDVDLGVGILRAVIAAAAALTAFVLSRNPITRRVGRRLFGVIAIFGLATILLGLTRNFAVAAIAAAALSGADQVSVFIRASIVPLATPEAMRGRVLAVENVFIGGSNELGAWESGQTAAWFGLGPAVVVGGIGTLVVVAAGWFLFPQLRNVDRFLDIKHNPTAPPF